MEMYFPRTGKEHSHKTFTREAVQFGYENERELEVMELGSLHCLIGVT
jgi:hypothetical protein